MYVYLQKIEWINIVIKKVVYICSFVFFVQLLAKTETADVFIVVVRKVSSSVWLIILVYNLR